VAALLSPDEIEKGRRFRFQKDRNLSWSARAALRALLGGYLAAAPAELRFQYEAAGRPRLAGGPCFSVSHSGTRVAIAIARAETGVDIERRQSESLCEWTRNEAYVKALGIGITGSAPPPDASWTFFDLSDEAYEGAVAVHVACAECRRFRLRASIA
jgi:phosphopantetheinyl transferase